LHILDGLLIAYLNIDAIIKIIRKEDEPKPVLMQRFKLSDTQAESILELKLRHLAKLEEMKITGEQSELAAEQADLKGTLKSKARLTELIKHELLELAEAHGDKRRTLVVEREAAQAIAESELVTSDPVTVILSERGWVRAAKGHDADVEALAYRSGDRFLAAALGRSNQPCIFLDSTGRAYNVATHTLPSARGQGEPLSGHLNPPDGSSFCAVLIGAPEDRWVVASSAGYGFVVRLEELYTRNKAGKAALRVPTGASVIPAAAVGADAAWLAAVSTDGRLLVFALSELPELAKGKGNKILGLPGKGAERLAAVCVLGEQQAVKIQSGERVMTLKAQDLDHYRAARGRRGSALPRGWRKVERMSADVS
jgi:topoisomerase-4 subunit A